MVLILSEKNETSTDNVIEWLLGKDCTIIRYHHESALQLEKIEQSSTGINCVWKSGNTVVDTHSIQSVWFRRGHFPHSFYQLPEDNSLNLYVHKHLHYETETLIGFIYKILSDKKSLNHPNCYNMNKLVALQNATQAGFEIPNTIITQNNAAGDTFTSIPSA